MQAKPTEPKRKLPTGISERHARTCPAASGAGRCRCIPSYRAFVFDRRSGEKIRKTFAGKGALAAAKGWRADALSQLGRGGLAAASRKTLRLAADEWLEGAAQRMILTRSGTPYKPSALRSYEADLRLRVLPDLGAMRLSDVQRRDVQALVDRLVGQGLSPSKIRNAIMPLRAIIRHAIERDELMTNPTTNLRLPALAGNRDRVADPAEAAALLAVLPEGDRAVWATAFYGGLRRGELRALACEHVDLKRGEIRVERAWDEAAGFIAPKSAKGTRTVPIPGALKVYLAEHLARTGRRGADLAFGRTASAPFVANSVRRHAEKAWASHYACGCDVVEKRDKCPEHAKGKLAPIGLHECRHTYVSLMYASGVPLETIGDYVGHSSAYMTEAYRHLLPSAGPDAAAKLDAYLAR